MAGKKRTTKKAATRKGRRRPGDAPATPPEPEDDSPARGEAFMAAVRALEEKHGCRVVPVRGAVERTESGAEIHHPPQLVAHVLPRNK